ncbi:hypothetical protein PWG71_16740 [Nocardiopsis sp. N85]|uniref:hypothetical protein n=1 Tax=Nocardiopsis sp. N85 TaxID=3029400 RepID=UPI00237FB9C7|nr:hypothetical protein [Nocardiopsis sp. N85]MDE3723039.1 hypothetical protein [Nocardiopsis sp. N85]
MSARRYLTAGIAALVSGGMTVGVGLSVNQIDLKQFDQRSVIWLGTALALATGMAVVAARTAGAPTPADGSDTRPATPSPLTHTGHADRETFTLTTPGERLRMRLLHPFTQDPGEVLGLVSGVLLLIAVGVLWIGQNTAPVHDLLVWIERRTDGTSPRTLLDYAPLFVTAGSLLFALTWVLTWFGKGAPGGHDRVIIDSHGITVLDLRRVRRPDRSYSVEWADLEEVRVSPTREGSAHAVLLTFVEDREPDHEWSERTGVTNPRGDAPIAFLVSPDQHDEHGHPVLPRLRSALERFGPASRAAP